MATEKLLFGETGGMGARASQNIPIIADPWVSDRARKTLDEVFDHGCPGREPWDRAVADCFTDIDPKIRRRSVHTRRHYLRGAVGYRRRAMARPPVYYGRS
jgi:hypothetical protein